MKKPDASTSNENQNSKDENTQSKEKEKDLSEKFLNAPGKRIVEERSLAQPVHHSFVERWSEVYKLGLPNDEKADLIKKLLIPKNCTFLDPPKLNKECSLAVHQTVRDRDDRIVAKQSKLLACFGVIGNAISTLVERDQDEDVPLTESLSAASRLLIDTLRDEVMIRRNLIIGNVNPEKRDILTGTVFDEFLFGKDLSEKLKQDKLTGQDVHVLSKKTAAPKNSKNEKGPLRHQIKSVVTVPSGGQKNQASASQQQKPKQNENQRHQSHDKFKGSRKASYSKKR